MVCEKLQHLQGRVQICGYANVLGCTHTNTNEFIRVNSGGAENAGVENAGVENTGAKTYGKPLEQKIKIRIN